MAASVEQEMLTTLEELRAARNAYFAALEIPLTPPPPPASEAAVRSLEQQLGKPLPPSYRAFLLTQNGWPEFDGEVNILSVSEIISLKGKRETELLTRIAKASGLESAKQWLIFGLSPQSISSYLFDPTQQDAAGEWPVIEYDEAEGVEKQHPNFIAFLKSSTAEAAEALEEVRQSQDLLNIKF